MLFPRKQKTASPKPRSAGLKRRALSCTAREWAIMQERAAANGQKTSAWILERALHGSPAARDSTEDSFDPAEIRRLLAVLEAITEPLERMDSDNPDSSLTMRQEIHFIYRKMIEDVLAAKGGQARLRRIMETVARDDIAIKE